MKKLKIGLVYDLREDYQLADGQPKDFYAEFDPPETIEAVENALKEQGHSIIKIGNIFNLIDFLKARLEDIDIFFNLAEGLYGRSREAQVPCLLDAYRKPYTGSDATTLCLSLDKHLTKSVMKLANINTSPWKVVNTIDDLGSIDMSYPLFAKPLHEGSSKGIESNAVIENYQTLKSRVENLLTIYKQPVLVENFLEGQEFTVGILEVDGQLQAFGAAEIRHRAFDKIEGEVEGWDVLPNAYLRILHQHDSLYNAVCQFAVKACYTLACKDISRVDVRYDKEGQIHLLEINPLPSLHPTYSAIAKISSQGEYSYENVVNTIVQSAASRFHISD